MMRKCIKSLFALIVLCAVINVTACDAGYHHSSSDSDVPHTYKEFVKALEDAEGGASMDDPVDIAFDGSATAFDLYVALNRVKKYVNLDISDSSVTGFDSSSSSSPGVFLIVSLSLPHNLDKIGDKAFEYCSRLKEVLIPNAVTSIGECAFYNCTSLTEVTIPASVEYIGSDAFAYCAGLNTVILQGDVYIADFAVFPDGRKFMEAAILANEAGSAYMAAHGTYRRNGNRWTRDG